MYGAIISSLPECLDETFSAATLPILVYLHNLLAL